MARDYIMKYRGFPSLTAARKRKLLDGLSTGAPIDIACEAAGIVKNTFYRWMRAGKALHLGEESSDTPYFLPRQADETDACWDARRLLFAWDCANLEDFFLDVIETSAEWRFKRRKT